MQKGKLLKKNRTVIIVSVLLIAVILCIGFIFLPKILKPNGGQVTTISQSSLEKVIEINDLSTLDYTYNAITAVYDEDSTKVKYYVAYEGTVTAGIDFTKIDIQTDEENKKIVITVPEPTIQAVNVNMGTMDFIFENEKYNEETVSQEAYKASIADLKKRAGEEETLLSMAKDNAIAAVKALIEPWVEQIDGEYEVEVK